MKAMNFLEYNGHKFTGVILMDNGEFRVAGETISMKLWGRDAIVQLAPRVCTANDRGSVHIADVEGTSVCISVNKALYETFGIDYKGRRGRCAKPGSTPSKERSKSRLAIGARTYIAQLKDGKRICRYNSLKTCEHCTGISRQELMAALDSGMAVDGFTFEVRERQKVTEPGKMW